MGLAFAAGVVVGYFLLPWAVRFVAARIAGE